MNEYSNLSPQEKREKEYKEYENTKDSSPSP